MYKYYQPNEKDVKDEIGDCAIRAFTKALNKTWLEVFDDLVPYARKHQCLLNQKPAYEDYLSDMGFRYHSMGSGKKSDVKGVAKYRKSKSYILYIKVGFRTHLVAVEDGNYYDTWDCGNKYVYGYYEKEEQI